MNTNYPLLIVCIAICLISECLTWRRFIMSDRPRSMKDAQLLAALKAIAAALEIAQVSPAVVQDLNAKIAAFDRETRR